MISFMLKQWIRHKERFLLSLIGVALISGVLIYLFNLTETMKGTVNNNLQKKWESAYDLVVTPPGSIFKEEQLVEPNYLNGINGGITYDQYKEIKSLNDIAIAAPVSILGYMPLSLNLNEKFKSEIKDKGIYKYTITETYYDGFSEKTLQHFDSFATGETIYSEGGIGFGSGYNGTVSLRQSQLIVGIDPEEEAKLVGLDQATTLSNTSRYLQPDDKALVSDRSGILLQGDVPHEEKSIFEIPILLNEQSFSNSKFEITLGKLALPFETPDEQENTVNQVIDEGGYSYLQEVEVTELDSFELSGTQFEDMVFNKLQHPDSDPSVSVNGTGLTFISSSLDYEEVNSPFPSRWFNSFTVSNRSINLENKLFEGNLPKSGFRDAKLRPHKTNDMGVPLLPIVKLNIIGTYSPEKLVFSNDPLTELPLETYRPAKADIVLGAKNEPLNPIQHFEGAPGPTGLLTSPPNILTTIEAAEEITGGSSISAIRIKVNGIEDMGELAQEKLEEMKREIQEMTGLDVFITRGSSPQSTIIEVKEEGATLGWIEQPWIHVGAAITIFREVSLGYSSVLLAVLLIGAMYILATTYVSYLTRKREYSILLALGWKTSMLRRMIITESVFFVLIIIITAVIVEVLLVANGQTFNVIKIGLISATAVVIYCLGILLPLFQVGRIQPYQGIKNGEIIRRSKRIISNNFLGGFVLNQIIQRTGRNLLSILAIAIPSTLLSFYLFVTIRLDGILFTSYLGEFVAVEINRSHYFIITAALLVGALTTAEMLWQNVMERQDELALFKSVGWKNGTVGKTIILEGAIIGFLAGLLGVILSMSYIGFMYDIFPWDSLTVLLLTIIIPVFIGVIGALIPAFKALKTLPYQLLKESS